MRAIMKSCAGQSRAVLLLATLVLAVLATACTSESSPPQPEPVPEPHYAPVPRNLCALLRVEDVVEGFDLNLPQWYEPSDSYREGEEHSQTNCIFSTESDDDRFAIGGARFEPTARFDISVYSDPAGVTDAYRQGRNSLEYRQESQSGTRAAVGGWWDEGEYSVVVHEVVEGATIYDLATGDASTVFVEYALRHENLYLRSQLVATTATEELEEATDVLHDLMVAVIDEIASHLDRAAGE